MRTRMAELRARRCLTHIAFFEYVVVVVVEEEEEGMGKGGRVSWSWSWRFYHETSRIEIQCVLSANKMARKDTE